MDNIQFKTFCNNEFKKRGFKKVKNTFYLAGIDLLCGISLQKSYYGNIYYVNYYYFIGDYKNSTVFPSRYENDIHGRILVMSRQQTYQGKHFITAQIEYTEYTEEELQPYFDKEFKEKILPPIYMGKVCILENLNKLYFLGLNQEDVMCKLQSRENTGD